MENFKAPFFILGGQIWMITAEEIDFFEAIAWVENFYSVIAPIVDFALVYILFPTERFILVWKSEIVQVNAFLANLVF